MSKSQINYNDLNPSQLKLVLQARTELEKEEAWAEIKKQIEEEEYKKQILRSSANNNNQKVEYEKISTESESSDSVQSDNEQRELPPIQKPEIIKQEPNNEQLDNYFKMIQNAQLKRDQIYYILMKHFCDFIIEGAFVKINEPNLIKKKEQNYTIAQVLGVVEGETSYKLEQTSTFKLLKLQFGEVKEAKIRHITLISNQQIQKQEFVVWQKRCEENGIQIPNKEFLLKKEKEIQKSTQKLTDDFIKSRIHTNLEKWSQNPKSNIHYRDLHVYQNFIKNLIQTNKSLIEQGEETISDLQEDEDGVKKQLKPDETSIVLKHQRQNKLKAEENLHLNEELKKIEQLLKTFKDNQNLKIEADNKNNNDQKQVNKPIKQNQVNIVNIEYQKHLDQKYIRQYPNIKTIDGSEQFKSKFLQMHSRDLPIDSLIDNMMTQE